MIITELTPNEGKQFPIETPNGTYLRLPIRTHIITDKDDMTDVVDRYAKPYIKTDDMLFISERVVAISQGRAYPIQDIHPSLLARILVRFVHKSPYGIGLGSPWTMELAVREAGAFRMLVASLASALTKPLGIRGVFYKVVGNNINAIDGPCSYTLPPYNGYAKLGPAEPDTVAKRLRDILHSEVSDKFKLYNTARSKVAVPTREWTDTISK
jgi:hypothetical protein